MESREHLQKQIKPFSPQEDNRPARIFQFLKPDAADIPPLDTVRDQRVRGPNGLQGKELKAFWAGVFRAENMTLEDLYPLRLRAAWRIAREWCILVGLIEQPNQSLQMAVDGKDPSPWDQRDFVPLIEIHEDPHVAAYYGEVKGIPLLPPAPPRIARHRDDYSPDRDKRLVLWCQIASRIAFGRLGIHARQDGRHGLAGLLDPLYARLAMPTPGELYAFEEVIVGEALGYLVESNIQEASIQLSDVYGLREHEIRQVLGMAQDSATRFTSASQESARALLLLRLEKILGDAQSSLNTRDAILVIREISRLKGLVRGTQKEASETAEGMVRIVQSLKKEGGQKKLPPPPK